MSIVSTEGDLALSGKVSMGSTAVALPCGITFKIPYPPKLSLILKRFKLTIRLPIRIPRLGLGLNCDMTKPINITAGLPWGGGRVSNVGHDLSIENDGSPATTDLNIGT